jgi:hypothetical protein
VKLAEAAGQFVCCSSNCCRISHAFLAFCLCNWGLIVSDMHAGCVSVVLASCETCMLSCTKLAVAVVGAGHARLQLAPCCAGMHGLSYLLPLVSCCCAGVAHRRESGRCCCRHWF